MQNIKNLKNDLNEDAPANSTTNVAGADGDLTAVGPSGKFAGCHVFRVNPQIYKQCIQGKRKYARWENYIDLKTEHGQAIRNYAYKYPSRPIIIQNEADDTMIYLRHNRYGGGKK